MNLKKYFKGQGLDVSRKKSLKFNGDHHFVEPNNLYSLKDKYSYESLDFIYSKNLLNESKFFRILIKEWLNFCKVGGFIIIEMVPNRIMSYEELIDETKLLIGNKGKIIKNEYDKSVRKGIVVVKKTKPILRENDSIDKWSFGILSGGFTDKQIDKSIKSILNLEIPNLEVIVCGKYNGKFKNNRKIKFIDFDPTLPWITKKKNLICAMAKYENLVIIHDHFYMNSDWYEGIKKYGNYFEILSNRIYDPLKRRAQDWVTYGIPLRPFSKYPFTGAGGNLDYADWDNNIDIGGFCVMKKSVWEKCPWDERLLLWQAEDMKISGDFYAEGFVPRFNQFSTSGTVKKEWGNYKLSYKFNKFKLGRATSPSLKTLILFYLKNILYKQFEVYLKRPDAHNEMQRTFSVPMISQN